MKNAQPILVAHRGYPQRYPENTLLGIEAALQCGAKAVEFDIQLSADGIPMLFHDDDLHRVTGMSGRIMDMDYLKLKTLSAYEPKRFDRQYQGTPLSSLEDLVECIIQYPDTQVFVEVKKHSLEYFGIETTMDNILAVLKPIKAQCVITSFEFAALISSRQKGFNTINWVIRDYNENAKLIAESLQPDFLCCNLKKTIKAKKPLWPGPWFWMLYETNNAATAMQCFHAGANYVETDDIGGLLTGLAQT